MHRSYRHIKDYELETEKLRDEGYCNTLFLLKIKHMGINVITALLPLISFWAFSLFAICSDIYGILPSRYGPSAFWSASHKRYICWLVDGF